MSNEQDDKKPSCWCSRRSATCTVKIRSSITWRWPI